MSGDPAVPGSRFARSTIRFLLFMIVLVAVVWVLRSGRLGPELTPAALREQVAAAGPLAPLVYLLALGILTNLMVPLSLMVVAGGLLFPWFTAFGLALPGALLADLIGYLVSAALLREPARRLLERMGWMGVLERLEARSAWRLAFMARFTPIPVGAQNYLLGIARLPLGPYLGASITAQVPWLFAFATLGSTSALPMRAPFYFGLACYFLLVLAAEWWWTRRTAARSGEEATEP